MKKTTTKRIVWLCLINGILWVWCSYLLAFLGREQIAETLSEVAIREVIGVILIYCIKSLFENILKYNKLSDRVDNRESEDTGNG